MIPVEYFWGILFIFFGIIGATRGLWKELGTSTILLLSLFALQFGWKLGGETVVSLAQKLPLGNAPVETVRALYFGISILFVAFIGYEGVVLEFPMKKLKGILKGILGFFGGLLNGYLVVGTIWDVVDNANYFGLEVMVNNISTPISRLLTSTYNDLAALLPLTLIGNEAVFLVLGMILLLAIVLK
jgi:uncharacterized membrane protein required for colicin V production